MDPHTGKNKAYKSSMYFRIYYFLIAEIWPMHSCLEECGEA